MGWRKYDLMVHSKSRLTNGNNVSKMTNVDTLLVVKWRKHFSNPITEESEGVETHSRFSDNNADPRCCIEWYLLFFFGGWVRSLRRETNMPAKLSSPSRAPVQKPSRQPLMLASAKINLSENKNVEGKRCKHTCHLQSTMNVVRSYPAWSNIRDSIGLDHSWFWSASHVHSIYCLSWELEKSLNFWGAATTINPSCRCKVFFLTVSNLRKLAFVPMLPTSGWP